MAAGLGIAADGSGGPCVVVAGLTRMHAFAVEGLVGQRDVVLRTFGRMMPRLDAFSGASVEPDGSIMLVVDAAGLVDRGLSMGQLRPDLVSAAADGANPDEGTGGTSRDASATGADVLIVDDALTVRELQRSILERAGYRVRTANDGLQALAALAERPADLVLTDVEMPNMDGFALTEAIRRNAVTAHLPVVIVTTQSGDEYRRRGLEAGADGYIVKSAFDSATLLEAVERLLGARAA
jgi:two-component system chemotaxis sensor kinase CheA